VDEESEAALGARLRKAPFISRVSVGYSQRDRVVPLAAGERAAG
jgi:hypothetical protein